MKRKKEKEKEPSEEIDKALLLSMLRREQLEEKITVQNLTTLIQKKGIEFPRKKKKKKEKEEKKKKKRR